MSHIYWPRCQVLPSEIPRRSSWGVIHIPWYLTFRIGEPDAICASNQFNPKSLPQCFCGVGSCLLSGKSSTMFWLHSNSWIWNGRDPLGWSQPMQILKFKQTCMPSLTPKIFQTCVFLATPSLLSLDHNSKIQKAEGSPTPVWTGFQPAVSYPIAMSTWF